MYPTERFNSISHLIGAVLSLIGLGALLAVAALEGDAWLFASYAIYGVTLVVLYSFSTLYHSFRPPKLKTIFQKLDHIAIYLLIAGTYTPFTLVTLDGSHGLIIFWVEWALALIGIVFELKLSPRKEWLQLSIYLMMGWLIILDFSALKAALPEAGLWWLEAGGLAYTVGIVFYVLDKRLRHAHGIWHLFVLSGSACHYVAVIGYVR